MFAAGVPADGTDKPRRGGYRRPWTAFVFHISQTDPIAS
jgi:hypothetical protein